MTQRKSTVVALGLTALLAPSLAACGSDDAAQQQAVCVDRHNPDDPNDDVRVDDSRCGSGDHDYHGGGDSNPLLWYFLGTQTGTRYPPVGSTIINNNYDRGTFTPPPSTVRVARGGAPAAGGKVTVSRGGFGGGAKSGGSGG